MDKFPTEILHSIFIRLSLSERLDCMSVCHHWYNVISQHSLLYEVHLHEKTFNKFMDMIERLPSRAVQVEKLNLHECPPLKFDKRKFCNLFPNMRKFLVSYIDREFYTRQNHNSRSFEFTRSESKLEEIYDWEECELTRQLAVSNMCGRLKVLTLNFSDSEKRIFNDDVVSQIINMPVLEQLIIRRTGINVAELETLHNNLPSISFLQLDEIEIDAGQMPRDVKPAASINRITLNIVAYENVQARVQLYQYMGMKYLNLDNVDIVDEVLESDSPRSIDLRQFFETGLFPFLKAVGPRLHKFKFENLPTGINVFKKLDEFGCKFRDLETVLNDWTLAGFVNLAYSEQSKYIKKLQINGWVSGSEDLLKNMPLLRDLDLFDWCVSSQGDYTSEGRSNLCNILDICGTKLSSLIMQSVETIPNQPIPSYTTSIETLSLSNITLNKPLADMISNCFPKLTRLILSGPIFDNITISLPKNHFEYVQFKTIYTSYYNGCLIKTLDNNQSQYYSSQGTAGRVFYMHSNPVSSNEYKDPLTVTFICSSIKDKTIQVMNVPQLNGWS